MTNDQSIIDIRSMCAIGQQGQLGLNGRLPWEGYEGPLYKADVERFFALTKGHVLMAGPKTVASVPDLAFKDRTIVQLRSHMDPQEMLDRFRGRRIFIGGGPAVWDAYAPYIVNWDITCLPYEGEADRWFNPSWLMANRN